MSQASTDFARWVPCDSRSDMQARTGDPLIARDELGFVGLAPDGTEKWSFFTTGPIACCGLTPTHITGETVEGEKFSFTLPAETS